MLCVQFLISTQRKSGDGALALFPFGTMYGLSSPKGLRLETYVFSPITPYCQTKVDSGCPMDHFSSSNPHHPECLDTSPDCQTNVGSRSTMDCRSRFDRDFKVSPLSPYAQCPAGLSFAFDFTNFLLQLSLLYSRVIALRISDPAHPPQAPTLDSQCNALICLDVQLILVIFSKLPYLAFHPGPTH